MNCRLVLSRLALGAALSLAGCAAEDADAPSRVQIATDQSRVSSSASCNANSLGSTQWVSTCTEGVSTCLGSAQKGRFCTGAMFACTVSVSAQGDRTYRWDQTEASTTIFFAQDSQSCILE